MGHNTCCVVNCTNNGKNSLCKFYIFPKSGWKLEQRKKWIAAVKRKKFPTASWKLEQRKKWINAIKRKNVDGSPWSPKPHDTICSAHFIGGKKSEEQASPSYVPTIFPTIYQTKKINESQIVGRYKRFMARRNTKGSLTEPITEKVTEVNPPQLSVFNQGCQVDMYSELKLRETTFICNRYIYSGYCDAEIQVEIATTSKIVLSNSTPQSENKSCCTSNNKRRLINNNEPTFYFVDISSIQNDQQIIDFDGVSFNKKGINN